MTIETENLFLAAHLPRHLRALLSGPEEFKNVAGLKVATGIREQLLSASPEFLARVKEARQADPWLFGFAVIHKIDNVLIGMGGFPTPPDSEGVAEIAYGIAPAYQGRGYRYRSGPGAHRFCLSRRACKNNSGSHSPEDKCIDTRPGEVRVN